MKTRFLSALALSLIAATFAHGQAVESKFRAADGVDIVFDVRGKGDTALVFLHGWCGDRSAWKHQLDEFAKDYLIVAVDQAGHGKSGKNRTAWTVAGLAQDVEGLIEDRKLKRVILVGHSMGGPVACLASKRMPGLVIGIIGADTLQNAEYKWPEEQSKKFLESFEKDFKGTMRMGIKGMFPEKADKDIVEGVIAVAEKQDPKMAIGLMRDMSALDQKKVLTDARAKIRCINAGSGAQFAVPTNIEVNKKYADFNAMIIEGVGHFPMLERPEEFNKKMRETLKEFAAK